MSIPSIESNEGYELMDQFARNVENEKDADKLFDALNRRKPFRNFKDTCIELGLIDEWHQFEAEYAKQEILDWLESEGYSCGRT